MKTAIHANSREGRVDWGVALLHDDALRLGVLAGRALLAASRTSLVGAELLQLGEALHGALVALSCEQA